VLVPEEVCVGARVDVGAGYADVFGRDAGGVDLTHDVVRTPAAGAPGLTLDAEVGMGALEVLHRPRIEDERGFAGRRGNEEDADGDREDAERAAARVAADRACAGSRG
jgi:hypothetical protein